MSNPPKNTKTTKYHPALSISNVKSLIPITLDLESSQHHSWAALFKVQARVHDVLEHIIPPTEKDAITAYEKTKAADLPLWKRLDAVVLQWIYATISTDILTSILVDDDSAEQAWKTVAALFHDNQNSRAMYLNKEFTNTSLADFLTTNAYCNRLKSLADQLANVGTPVNDHSLVLKMLQGLTKPYSNFVTVMQNKKNLPLFATTWSKLALEETTLLERTKQEALVTNHNYSTNDSTSSQTISLVVQSPTKTATITKIATKIAEAVADSLVGTVRLVVDMAATAGVVKPTVVDVRCSSNGNNLHDGR